VDCELFKRMAALEGEHWWFLGRNAMVRALVERECVRRGGHVARLVDVGPGTGALLRDFGALVDEAVGVETDPTAVELVRARGLDVRVAPADDLPVAAASVDLVTAFDVLEHVQDDVAAGREFRRVLRPDGAALVTVPAYTWLWSEHDELHAHERRYTRAQLTRTLAAAGFDVRESGYFMSRLFPLAVAERFAAKLLHRPTRDLALPPRWLNRVFLQILLGERSRVLRGGFPFGLTVFAIGVPRAAA
jgi:SAM-dependent methyltransferase